MAKKTCILALDLGTTGNRAIAFDPKGAMLAQSYQEFPQIYPQPAWVEHDPNQILTSALSVLKQTIQQVDGYSIAGIGITNQRETTIIWEKSTGKPIHNAIVWQCRRTADLCKQLQSSAPMIKKKTGLFLDPYFSASKIQWLLDHVTGARNKAEKGELLFGTVDTWILWQLTQGQSHLTEASNASRTMIYNIHTGQYDPELLSLFNIPSQILPQVCDSASQFGVWENIPILGILGDQQASLFAQGGWDESVIKNTYGTGLFLVTSTGSQIPAAGNLINTVAWQLNGQRTYALEGSIFVGGSAVQWLRDGLQVIQHAAETEQLATELTDNEDVYFVPALAGLGAPYWDPNARGVFIGLTRGTTKSHFARAVLESLAYQTRDVVEEIYKNIPQKKLSILRVDGGAIKNNFLMQFQADMLGLQIERPVIAETTALGATGIAGIQAGIWDQKQFSLVRTIEKTFSPVMPTDQQSRYYQKWKSAVAKSLDWA